MHKLFKRILNLVYVPTCVNCKTRLYESDRCLCDDCFDKYLDEREKYCDFCGMSAHMCMCQPHNMMINGCVDYRKLVFYPAGKKQNVVRSIVYSVKRRNNVPLAKFVAKEIANEDKYSYGEDTIVTYCPRSIKNRKKYGYDHARLIAKEYADIKGITFADALKRNPFHKGTEQKLLNYSQRAANMQKAFFVKKEADVRGKTVILIDDVVTSGATMGECMSMLYDAGVKNVICRSFAQTYKKNKSKKD